MNLDTTVSISLLLSLVSCAGVIYTILTTARKNQKGERKEEDSERNKEFEEKLNIEKNFVKINLKLDAFCEDVREILKNQEKSNDELRRVSDQLIKENAMIEDHERRIKALEEK